ncbi:MAG TPA: hypothetical protein VFV67_14520 [Actinophytocola sp.]|uniref:hypothetical protein n=1 Tax=Actinophytocola sp. TaxID=1872138 RepID=UPI002DB66326|nr:hypothetical protein [Actinophytocola sp.]HEU5471862.1 hypothetical protein [Actinophytocola sp.]
MPLVQDKLNVVGEFHSESGPRRAMEARFCLAKTRSPNYWRENEFPDLHQEVSSRARRGQGHGGAQGADLMELRAAHAASLLVEKTTELSATAAKLAGVARVMTPKIYRLFNEKINAVHRFRVRAAGGWRPTRTTELNTAAAAIFDGTEHACQAYLDATPDLSTLTLSAQSAAAQAFADGLNAVSGQLDVLKNAVGATGLGNDPTALAAHVQAQRSAFMGLAAGMSSQLGVWKIGQGHIDDLTSGRSKIDMSRANFVTRDDFIQEFTDWVREEVARKRAREQQAQQPTQQIT